MDEAGFRSWLEANYHQNTVSTKLYEARQIEAAFGDLDDHYERDRLNEVSATLVYSASDRSKGRPNPTPMSIGGDLYSNLSNLRTTINYYRNFRAGNGIVQDSANSKITPENLSLLRASRQKTRYSELSAEERLAYKQITDALTGFGDLIRNVLGSEEYECRLTSGFHLESGVRGSIPKDLWVGVFPKENTKPFVGSPQLFVIVSSRGVEFGFAPSTHPSGFSNGDIKRAVKEAAPKIFDLMPNPDDDLGQAIATEIQKVAGWHFQRRTRLDSGHSDFSDMFRWLEFLKSEEGKLEAGGSISRYLSAAEIENVNLGDEIAAMAQLFRPLMETVRANKRLLSSEFEPNLRPENSLEFSTRMSVFLGEFDEARKKTFGKVPSLWDAADKLIGWLQTCDPIKDRRYLTVDWSPGKGVWAGVPWISILNSRITKSTRYGVYCVFLVSNDLEKVYLALAQGVEEVSEQNGQGNGKRILEETAAKLRAQVGYLANFGFQLGNDFDLKSTSDRGKNYVRGTIAFIELDAKSLPSDPEITDKISVLLDTYDLLDGENSLAGDPEEEADLKELEPIPLTIEEAMNGLFMSENEFRRILQVWRQKKNVVLQGAPGVGKTFVARRLAYALLGARDSKRVATVQFHQSYGYEDFVQGYRPNGTGGFSLSDGVFYDFCMRAREEPTKQFVFIIDEINRGNLSKIFGELMLLIESDKRAREWAARLAYARPSDEAFYVPDNVFVLGMMNTADRSLSLVDYALRRRFGFITLEPQYKSVSFSTALIEASVTTEVVSHIVGRMSELNDQISADKLNLGRGFRIGHSFFVPTFEVSNSKEWCNLIVETEVRPLLEEYWPDDPDKVDDACQALLVH